MPNNHVQNQQVTINSLKFDRNIARSWKCDLLRTEGPLMEFLGVFEFEVNHPHLGTIGPGTLSYEYYWLDRWYNVFRFHEPDGTFRNYYCNVNMPPTFSNGVLEYVDLDIDLVVWKDWSQDLLDRDEFEANAKHYGHADEVFQQVRNSLSELKRLIARREFPFDYRQE